MNFLKDEADDGGEGAKAVVSRLHYYFEHHGEGEEEVLLYADNCAGRNKNNIVMQYLAWRVSTNLYQD